MAKQKPIDADVENSYRAFVFYEAPDKTIYAEKVAGAIEKFRECPRTRYAMCYGYPCMFWNAEKKWCNYAKAFEVLANMGGGKE